MPTWEEIGEADSASTIEPEDYDAYHEFMKERHRFYEALLPGVIERQKLEPQYATIRKGQAMIWSTNLLHGGAKQNDDSAPGTAR